MSNPTIIATRVRRLLEGTSSLTTEDVRFGCWFATDPHPDYAVLVREATDAGLYVVVMVAKNDSRAMITDSMDHIIHETVHDTVSVDGIVFTAYGQVGGAYKYLVFTPTPEKLIEIYETLHVIVSGPYKGLRYRHPLSCEEIEQHIGDEKFFEIHETGCERNEWPCPTLSQDRDDSGAANYLFPDETSLAAFMHSDGQHLVPNAHPTYPAGSRAICSIRDTPVQHSPDNERFVVLGVTDGFIRRSGLPVSHFTDEDLMEI